MTEKEDCGIGEALCFLFVMGICVLFLYNILYNKFLEPEILTNGVENSKVCLNNYLNKKLISQKDDCFFLYREITKEKLNTVDDNSAKEELIKQNLLHEDPSPSKTESNNRKCYHDFLDKIYIQKDSSCLDKYIYAMRVIMLSNRELIEKLKEGELSEEELESYFDKELKDKKDNGEEWYKENKFKIKDKEVMRVLSDMSILEEGEYKSNTKINIFGKEDSSAKEESSTKEESQKKDDTMSYNTINIFDSKAEKE